MEAMPFGWRARVTFLLVLVMVTENGDGKRPETILADVFTKPFAPRELASPECIRDSEIYLKALESYTPWALQMYDASVKIPSGLITGNYKLLGNFDECLEVKSERGFVGQACNVAVQFEISEDDGAPRRELDIGDLFVNVAIASNATKWTSGNTIIYEWIWCVPSTCNHIEIQEAVELVLDPLKVEGRVDLIVNVPKESCHTIETIRVTWDIVDWCYISLLALFALLIIASTAYDIALQNRIIKPELKDVFTSFSLYTNGKKLLRTTRPRKYIDCLDGIRFISICWIVYGHTYYNEAVGVKMNLTQIPWMHHDWSNMLVLNATIITDAFFLLSGILLAYNELSKEEKFNAASKWRFDVIGLYVHRYIRLTPAYAMMIGFYATLFYKFGTGPHWNMWVGSNKDFCRKNWWINLLYINNYINLESMCMSHSWYLSTDMQLVWLSPLILYPMLKFRSHIVIIVLAVCLFLSVLVPFVITYTLRLTGLMLYYKEQMDVAMVYLEIYTKVYNRFGPYVIGLGLGYLLHKTKSYNVKLRVWYVICGWLIAIMAGLLVFFGPRGMYFDTHVYNRLEASFYAGFHRQVFVLSISWIIFCCVHGYAGPINHFLSWRGWIIFSKLVYCIYLCHFLFVLSDTGAVRTTGNLTRMNVMRAFLANMMFTIILSVVWTLCFEMPFIAIDTALFSGRKRKQNNYGSTESGKEICQSKSESLVYDNPQKLDIPNDNPTGIVNYPRKNHENGIGCVNEGIEKDSDEIYVLTK